METEVEVEKEKERESPELTRRVSYQIRRWRLKRRMTQRYLSVAIGQGESYIATVESAPRMPSFLAAMRICRVLAIDPDDLLSPVKGQAESADVLPSPADEES